MPDTHAPQLEPWQWPETTWRQASSSPVRAGRQPLKPKAWPNGARCAVAITFDAGHETIPLRDTDKSDSASARGGSGNRQAMPRIRKLLEQREASCVLLFPAVSALLHPEECARQPMTGTKSASTPGSTRPTRCCRERPNTT